MSEADNYLMVPVRLDALRVDSTLKSRPAMADFSKLPYFDGSRDVNGGTAFVSEELVSAPFDDTGELSPGVHLHWALPDALTQSLDVRSKKDKELEAHSKKPKGFAFPAVPNMWLITRYDGEDTVGTSYLVESDYVYPPGEGATSGAVCYPIGYENAGPGEPPFRYMGRCLDEAHWGWLDKPHEHLKQVTGYSLTALGYGEPTFSAFYQNCHSVFGFKDPKPPIKGVETTYYLAGWYREAEHDFCHADIVKKHFAHRAFDFENAKKNTSCHSQNGLKFSQSFNWNVAKNEVEGATDFPVNSLYFSRLILTADKPPKAQDSMASLSVSIANTATEALSAHLAEALPGNKSEIEDKLEALHLLQDLDHLSVDTGPKFREARHARGFQAVPSGVLWELRAAQAETKAGAVKPARSNVGLSIELAHSLNNLNAVQKKLDENEAATNSVRSVIFADWYKYQLCKYPPGDQGEDYPQIDEAQFLLKEHDFKWLKKFTDSKTKLENKLTDAKAQITEQLKKLDEEAIAKHKASKSSVPIEPPLYTLAKVAAPRYWEPAEPVILLTGPQVKPTDRHGQSGSIDCGIFAKKPVDLRFQSAGLKEKIDALFVEARKRTDPKNSSPEPIGFRQTGGDPWTPLIVEWEAELRSLYQDRNLQNRQTYTYNANHILSQYEMLQNNTDLVPLESLKSSPESLKVDTQPSVFQGRGILTPHAKPTLIQQIEQYLKAHLYPFCEDTAGLHPESKMKEEKANAFMQARYLALDQDTRMLFRFLDHKLTPAKDSATPFPEDKREEIMEWYQTSDMVSCDKFIHEILEIQKHITDNFNVLTQSLGGFNAALLARKQTFQLTVGDPLAFPDQNAIGDTENKWQLSDYRQFANDVKDKVGGHNRFAPNPMQGFAPVRDGRMRLSKLRLTDTFGRTADIPTNVLDNAGKSDTFSSPDPDGLSPGEFVLSPRFTQPLRLGLRWLAGEHVDGGENSETAEDLETNAHPATSPICGWLVPVTADNSLEVFSSDGDPLGRLDKNGEWHPPIGREGFNAEANDPELEKAIPNAHLRRVVRWARGKDGIYSIFLSTLQNAQENVEPSDWAAHEAMFLMIGRPIAVVRTNLKMDMQGLPALDPSWETYRKALMNGHNLQLESAQIRDVNVSVRVGEHSQFNDGLLGYWCETPATKGHPAPDLPAEFLSPQADTDRETRKVGDRSVRAAQDKHDQAEPFNIEMSLNDDAKNLTLLMDPRGKLHASCGVLPVKSIQIPPDQCLQALKKIEISIRVMTVLSPQKPFDGEMAAIEMIRPNVEGYDTSWTEQRGKSHWPRTDSFLRPNPDAEHTHKNELRDGYLILRKSPPE